MNTTRRELLKSAACMAAMSAIGLPAYGQAIDVAKILNGFAAGGTNDALSRHLGHQLQGSYAKAVVVENKTGAAGQIAVGATKAAIPDGRTMLVAPMATLAIYPFIYKSLPYDPFQDLTPVSLAGVFDSGFAVGPKVPNSVRSISDFLTWVKANPSQGTCASPAAGTPQHFMIELLARAGKVDLVHVPYRGSQPAVIDALGGQVAAVAAPVGEFQQHVGAGKLRILATATEKRGRFTPDVPTFLEQGYKGLIFAEWFAVFLPARAPRELVTRLNSEVRRALTKPELIEGLAKVGIEAKGSSPEELAQRLKDDAAHWGPVVKTIGFKAD